MPYKDIYTKRLKQKEYSKTYYDKYPLRNKAKKAVWHANKKAKALGLSDKLHRIDVEKLLITNKKCLFCDSKENLSIDHIIPFSKGGSNTIDNIQIICWLCNMKKRAKLEPGMWAENYNYCVVCGTKEKRHEAKGLCITCYDRKRKNNI